MVSQQALFVLQGNQLLRTQRCVRFGSRFQVPVSRFKLRFRATARAMLHERVGVKIRARTVRVRDRLMKSGSVRIRVEV